MAEKSLNAPSLMQCFTEYGSASGPLLGYGSPDANVVKWGAFQTEGNWAVGGMAASNVRLCESRYCLLVHVRQNAEKS